MYKMTFVSCTLTNATEHFHSQSTCHSMTASLASLGLLSVEPRTLEHCHKILKSNTQHIHYIILKTTLLHKQVAKAEMSKTFALVEGGMQFFSFDC